MPPNPSPHTVEGTGELGRAGDVAPVWVSGGRRVNAYMTLAIGAVLLLGITAVVLRIARVPLGWAPYYAAARGAVQLSIVGFALHGVFRAPEPQLR